MIEELEKALKKTKVVYQNYLGILQPAGTRTQTSMHWIQESIEQYAEITINKKVVSWVPVQFKGRLDRYENHADIVLSDRLNPCWTRFVACKEMSHLVIDTLDESIDSFSAINTADKAKVAISQLIRLQSGAGADLEELGAPAKSEIIAIHCAIELLFPVTERKALLNAGHDKDSNSVLFSIANKYKIPKHYVERALSDGYMELIGGIAQKAHDEVFG